MAHLTGPACSDWSRQVGLDPVGTAGSYQGYMLVEQPLPWPVDIGALPEVAQVGEVAEALGMRAQALFGSLKPAPRGQGDGGRLRVVCYRPARPGWAGPLVRSEALSEPGQVAQAAAELVAGQDSRAPSEGVVDVLVCTHGRRDACCGSKGSQLFGQLLGALEELSLAGRPACRPADEGAREGAELRPWRTSHTGGHRFAPTALVLPWATLWAFADVELLLAVSAQQGPVERFLPRYRGCALLASPRHQALERDVLARVGWPLLNGFRRGADGPDGTVRLVTEEAGEWEAVVRPGRRVPQPDCHTPPALAAKQGVEWVVEDLRQLAVPSQRA